MCGRVGALFVKVTRWRWRSRMKMTASAPTRTISHQYSRRRSISSPVPLCIITSAKLDEIGEQQSQKEAQDRNRQGLGDQRRTRIGSAPAGAAHPRGLAHDSRKFARLEIVGLARKDQPAGQGAMMKAPANLAHFVKVERLASTPLDAPRKPVGGAQGTVPQRGE